MEEHTHAHTHDHSHNHEDFEATKKEELTRIIIAAAFLVLGHLLEGRGGLAETFALLSFAVSYLTVGFTVVRRAIEDLLHGGVFNECLMMSIASLGALVIGEYGEGCAVVLLYSVGEFIHGAALASSKKKIRAIESESGHPHIHEVGENESFIAAFAKYYTPVICAVALLIILVPPLFLGGLWRDWLYRGFSALVIGCPCAIVISVPLSFSCAIDACTRKGVYVYHTNALEKLYRSKGTTSEGIILPDGDESKLQFAYRAAKKAVLIARENIVLALAVKVVVLVLVIFLEKELPLWLAAFSDVGIAALAILNSLRSLRIK